MATEGLRERLRRDRFFQLGLVLVALVVSAAVLAPWIAPFDPLRGDLRNAYLLGPGGRFLLGTDAQGRDVFSRVLYGARLSLIIGFTTVTFGIIVGTLLGLLSGYFGGWLDNVVMRFMDVLLAFPSLLLAIVGVTKSIFRQHQPLHPLLCNSLPGQLQHLAQVVCHRGAAV